MTVWLVSARISSKLRGWDSGIASLLCASSPEPEGALQGGPLFGPPTLKLNDAPARCALKWLARRGAKQSPVNKLDWALIGWSRGARTRSGIGAKESSAMRGCAGSYIRRRRGWRWRRRRRDLWDNSGPTWPSALRWPITGSIAERRRSSRLMTPNTARFWPEMKTRRGSCASCPRYLSHGEFRIK